MLSCDQLLLIPFLPSAWQSVILTPLGSCQGRGLARCIGLFHRGYSGSREYLPRDDQDGTSLNSVCLSMACWEGNSLKQFLNGAKKLRKSEGKKQTTAMNRQEHVGGGGVNRSQVLPLSNPVVLDVCGYMWGFTSLSPKVIIYNTRSHQLVLLHRSP